MTKLGRFFTRILSFSAEREAAQHTYIATVSQSRSPLFFSHLEVSDTLDGRFELVVLHLFLLQHRLGGETSLQARRFSRALSEAFFADMDSTLRELGVGDTGVGRRIRAMAESYFGHLKAYTEALSDRPALEAALGRNIYGTSAELPSLAVSVLATYVQDTLKALTKQDTTLLLSGTVTFPAVPAGYTILEASAFTPASVRVREEAMT